MSSMIQAGALDELTAHHKLPQPVYVTRPTMPRLEDYTRLLEQIWESRWLTNDGALHRELEHRLAAYLGVEHLSLFCNGEIALLVALQALRINSGEVITTPFTFPGTPHALFWNNIRPVFCDIEPETLNLDPLRVERHIGPDTRAILPVHIFGNPCDVRAIQEIAERHGLQVIYDAAHAFGVRVDGQPLASFGDISMLSFHATKLFTTIEGGALVVGAESMRRRVNFLKNFGIADEETVIGPGINGKMNEVQAAFGLLQLQIVEDEIAGRAVLDALYRQNLRDVPGIAVLPELPGVRRNYAYFPILVDPESYGLSRDELNTALKKFNIYTRKYFHPLCSHYPCYAALPSAQPANLPVAERVAGRVLCLPIYGTLPADVVRTTCTAIREIRKAVAS